METSKAKITSRSRALQDYKDRAAISPLDVAALLGVSEPTTRALIAREDFPSLRAGRRILLPMDAFLRWLDEQAGMGK